jgi:hypothetical protein
MLPPATALAAAQADAEQSRLAAQKAEAEKTGNACEIVRPNELGPSNARQRCGAWDRQPWSAVLFDTWRGKYSIEVPVCTRETPGESRQVFLLAYTRAHIVHGGGDTDNVER